MTVAVRDVIRWVVSGPRNIDHAIRPGGAFFVMSFCSLGFVRNWVHGSPPRRVCGRCRIVLRKPETTLRGAT
jgi:hypothetical protein